MKLALHKQLPTPSERRNLNMVLAGLSKRWMLGLALFSAAVGQSANADWPSFWHAKHIDYARNNVWPQPFVDVDAQAVQAPFAVMKHNGWRAHNTIGNELFREGDCSLNLAGSRRVEWIAKQAPHDRRTIYVLRGTNQDETDLRLASVHQSLASMQIGGPIPQVVVTDIEPAAASGGWATSVSRQWMQNLPAPKLPSTTASGTAGVAGEN
jgi:hypothetical protein